MSEHREDTEGLTTILGVGNVVLTDEGDGDESTVFFPLDAEVTWSFSE